MEIGIWHIIGAAFIGYWILCRSLRWQKANEIANRFKGRDPYSLSVEEAQWVVRQIARLEMWKMTRLSTGFALFRTYGIKSIAEILLKTTQFVDVKTGGKRYADTGILIYDFTTFPFDSERHAQALARMNWIHSHYPISNDDKLYTLSVFVSVPKVWLERYDWRPITELETAAWWIMWRELGYQMHIENIPETFEEMKAWADEYEKRAMLPCDQAHELAETAMGLLLFYIPRFIKPFVKRLLIAIMDDRLRKAMMYPEQPLWVYKFLEYFVAVRRFLLRNFFLPRYKGTSYTTEEKNQFGRYNINYTDNEPWYMTPDKVSPFKRFMNDLTGKPNPSPEYRSEGFVYEEVGPKIFEGKGQDKMAKEIDEIMERGKLLKQLKSSGGCPLAFN